MIDAPIPAADKRWFRRGQRWRVLDDRALFDPRGYAVDVIADKDVARQFVIEHHYEGTCSPCTIALGLYGPGARLVGVGIYGESAGPEVLSKYGGPLVEQSVELGRFVLLPDVAFNGETWFLARASKLLAREKGIRALLSFADPLERRCGELLVKPCHYGTIYQATNALYVGRATPRTHLVGPDGRPVSARALSKITSHDRGWEYATRQLEAVGAPARAVGEDGKSYLARVRATPGFTNRRHPGNHAYVFGLDDVARATLRTHHAERLQAYPNRKVA